MQEGRADPVLLASADRPEGFAAVVMQRHLEAYL